MNFSETIVPQIFSIMYEAGQEILKVYNEGFTVDTKADLSPITLADRISHSILVQKLTELDNTIPVLSEESEIPVYEQRQKLQKFWLIDPLDGTKEFVEKNGEFTINIAMISLSSDNTWRPVFGFVYAPVLDSAYLGWVDDENAPSSKLMGQAYSVSDMKKSLGSWRDGANELVPIRDIGYYNMPMRILVSRSHCDSATDEFIKKIQDVVGKLETCKLGSSLKLCKIASGFAHAYPRFTPSMEWDTAAAHAICRAVGVCIIDVNTKKELEYNKKELRNSGIFATAIPTLLDFLCDHIN